MQRYGGPKSNIVSASVPLEALGDLYELYMWPLEPRCVRDV